MDMINLPSDVKKFMHAHISECNNKIAYDLSAFPNSHEESLDLTFISHFATKQGPIAFGSGWTLRFDAHYIGGGRHFRNWEVADLGLMVIFRKGGKIVRSKLAFLQSKKLYATTIKYQPVDPYYRMGMGRLLVTDEEHQELVETRTLKYSDASKYKAFKKDNEQQQAMSSFSDRFNVKMYYLFYNPLDIPWSIDVPVAKMPSPIPNKVGCRVVPKGFLDSALRDYDRNHMPSYGEIKYLLEGDFAKQNMDAGWRLEYFINDLFTGCKEGLIDDSPNFQVMISLLNQKSAPISSALSITFDLEA
jgi:hypothetical protein